MNASYVRSVLSRLNTATLYVANQNSHKYFPKLTTPVEEMNDTEIKESIKNMIMYLQAPEYSFMMFRHKNTK
jgi:hypothetical protein